MSLMHIFIVVSLCVVMFYVIYSFVDTRRTHADNNLFLHSKRYSQRELKRAIFLSQFGRTIQIFVTILIIGFIIVVSAIRILEFANVI